jgi:hypothetical protein
MTGNLGTSLRYGLLIAIVAAAGTASWAQDRAKGTIEGTVVNELGKPVSKAKVHAELIHSRPQSSVYRFEETDENGQFFIDQLDWGEYIVGAMKKEEGYPYQLNRLYVTDAPPHVTLKPQEPIARVQIQFTWKAAVLTGHVTCRDTRAPFQATFRLSRKPNSTIAESYQTAQFDNHRILIPPGTPIFLEVSADGYKTWYFGGSAESSKSSPLRLESGQTMTLDIALEPDPLAPSQKRK